MGILPFLLTLLFMLVVGTGFLFRGKMSSTFSGTGSPLNGKLIKYALLSILGLTLLATWSTWSTWLSELMANGAIGKETGLDSDTFQTGIFILALVLGVGFTIKLIGATGQSLIADGIIWGVFICVIALIVAPKVLVLNGAIPDPKASICTNQTYPNGVGSGKPGQMIPGALAAAGGTIFLCPGDAPRAIVVPAGMKLVVLFDQLFDQQNKQVLAGRGIWDFLSYEPSNIGGGYYLSVRDGGFTSSGLPYIRVFLYSTY